MIVFNHLTSKEREHIRGLLLDWRNLKVDSDFVLKYFNDLIETKKTAVFSELLKQGRIKICV